MNNMSANAIKSLAAILAIVLAVPVMAETLIWTGSSGVNGSKWFIYSTGNWTNSAGATVQWSNANDAYFDDGSDYRNVEIASVVSPANITFNISRDMVLTNTSTSGYISSADTFTKDGPGTLWINPIIGAAANRINMSTNTVHVRGGTLKVSSPNCNQALGDPAKGWRAYVYDGGKLWIAERNALAYASTNDVNKNHVGITVYTNGILSFKNGVMNNQNINNVRTLDLVGGTMELPDIGNHSTGFLRVFERFSFGENPTKTPYVFDPITPEAITQPIAAQQNRLQLGTNTEFRVADITGDSAADVTFNNPVIAVREWENALGPCGFRKTGSGKMVIAAPFIYDSMVDRPNGPIMIEEGELEYTQPYALEPYTNTVVRINTNATLTINGNMFVNIDSTTKGDETALETNKVPRPIVVDHGTLNLKGAVGHYAFGDLTLDHAQISFAEVTGSASYGVLSLLGKLTLKGDAPIAITPDTFPTAKANGGASYDEWTKVLLCKELTDFCVDDITGDTNVDFTVACVLQNQRSRPGHYWPASGFVKTGPGTMVISNASNLFTGNIDVREGVLSVGVPTGYNAHAGYMPSSSLFGAFKAEVEDTRRIIVSDTGTL